MRSTLFSLKPVTSAFTVLPEGVCILHAFNGGALAAEAFALRGAYFSVGSMFARGGSLKTRARVALLPEERLLLESDVFLEPGVDAREDLLSALRWLAGVRGVEEGVLAERIAENARRLCSVSV